MFVGIDSICSESNALFDTRLSPYSFSYVELKNGIFDEFLVSNNPTIDSSTDRKEWDFDTVFLATFNNTYECGNIQQGGQDIEKIRFKKRLKGTVDWILFDEVDYDPDVNLYIVNDRLAYSLDEYDYAIVPVAQGIEGDIVSSSIQCRFSGLWVVDAEDSVKLFYNLEYGDISHNRNVQTIELLESEYPMVYSTPLAYASGSNSAVVVGKNTGHDGVNVDYLDDRKVVDSAIKFLGNKKPKLLKDGNGRKKVVIINNINEATMDNMQGGVHTISFDWTEIANADKREDLVNTGLLPESDE